MNVPLPPLSSFLDDGGEEEEGGEEGGGGVVVDPFLWGAANANPGGEQTRVVWEARPGCKLTFANSPSPGGHVAVLVMPRKEGRGRTGGTKIVLVDGAGGEVRSFPLTGRPVGLSWSN